MAEKNVEKSVEKQEVYVPKFQHWPKDVKLTRLTNGWLVAIVKVTPDLAIEMKSRNWSQQRKSKPVRIELMASDIRDGKWKLTHQGIAFDDAGTLWDGQNRLDAIVVADKPADMLVFFGVGRAGKTGEAEVVDTHAVRNLFDASLISGMDVPKRATTAFNSTMRYAISNGNQALRRMTQQTKLRNMESIKPAILFAVEAGGTSNVGKTTYVAPAMAAVVCAYYHVDHDVLKRFVKVLCEEETAGPGDAAATALRQHIQSNKARHELATFLKTCGAIRAFVNRNDTTRVGSVTINPYPIADRIKVPDSAEAPEIIEEDSDPKTKML